VAGDMGTELLAGIAGGYPAQVGSASRKRQVMGVHQRLKDDRKKVRAHLSPEERARNLRISEKIDVLVKGGEVPNTKAGRAKAAATAYSMERAGRLRRYGKYVPVKKG